MVSRLTGSGAVNYDSSVRLLPDQCTTVLAGAWNRAIFTPQWVTQNILGTRPEVALQVGGEFAIQMTTADVQMIYQTGRVQFAPRREDEAAFDAATAAARALLNRLSHTPVNAVGLNFVFVVDEPASRVQRYLTQVAVPFHVHGSFGPLGVGVRAVVPNPPDGEINLLLDAGPTGLGLEVNYHWNTRGADAGVGVLERNRSWDLKAKAADLAARLLEMEAGP